MSEIIQNVNELKKRVLFTPLETKEALHDWIEVFLGIDLPDCVVANEGPNPSNSSPMDMIFEVYNAALKNDRPDLSRMMAYASRDSFKCTEKGTRLLSKERGLVPIEEVKIGEVIWSGKSWRRVTDWIHDGVKDSVTVELRNGARLTTSPIHRVWTWSPGETPSWKKVSELTSEDIVRWDTESSFSIGDIDQEEFDVGYLCGILTGDGCLRFINKGHVTLTNVDAGVVSFWKKACVKIIGREPKSYSKPIDWRINSKLMCAHLLELGLTESYSWEKDLPDRCARNKSVLIGFLSGLFDTDGKVNTKGAVSFDMTAEKLLRKLQVALCALGVDSSFFANRLYPEHGQKHQVFKLTINQNAVPRLIDAGFVMSAAKANIFWTAKTFDAHDGIPKKQLKQLLDRLPSKGGRWRKQVSLKPKTSYNTITREKVDGLIAYGLENGFLQEQEVDFWRESSKSRWTNVRSVSKRKADFYDLTVEEDHSYWSNGVISHNTLGASILEILMVLHLGRDVGHMAAIEEQAQRAQEYVKAFFNKPFLRDFVIGDNKRRIDVVRYFDGATGINLTEKEWGSLIESDKLRYRRIHNYITIVICSMRGANGLHVPFLCVDEIDVVQDPKAYEQAKLIPSQTRDNNFLPLTLLTSTRKSGVGLVQDELDNAERRQLVVRHWNVIDVTEKCPAERHRPDLPKLAVYRSDDTLRALTQAEYESLPEEKLHLYVKDECFDGCLTNCKIFAMCRGKLATSQKSESPLLRKINVTQNRFRDTSEEFAKAELLCWKPSSEGLVYPRFDSQIHMLTAAEIANKITGDNYSPNMTKQELYRLCQSREMVFYAGMDFGYTHNFAVVVGVKDGARMFVLDCHAVAELELPQKIDLCNRRIRHLNPTIFPDPEDPSTIKSFKVAGFRIRDFKKGKGSVIGGIEAVRMKLMPVVGLPQLFFLKGDDGIDLLIRRLQRYHWLLDAAGRPTDEPTDKEDDECFTEATEVLTNTGWISLADVKDTDQVMVVTEDGNSFFEKPLKVIHKEYTGEMIGVNHSHLEWEATSNHSHAVMSKTDWRVKKEFRLQKRSVEEMFGEMYWANNVSVWPEGKGFFPQGVDEAWFTGFWLAEGCFDSGRPTYLIVDQTKEPQKTIVRETIQRLGWRWSETHKGNSTRFVVSGQRERAEAWRAIYGSGAKNKRIGVENLLQMSSEERRALWEGYMAGDGSVTTSCWHFDSVSKRLIDDVQILTLMLGYGCRIVSYDCMREGRSFVNPQGDTYLASKTYRGHILRKKAVAHIKKKDFVNKKTNSVQVHCVRTSSGYFLARTNGKVFVAGNCDALRYLIMNVFAPKGKITVTKNDEPKLLASIESTPSYTTQNWARQIISEQMGTVFSDLDEMPVTQSRGKGKTGKFIYDI